MRAIRFLLAAAVLTTGCSMTKTSIVSSWKNPDVHRFNFQKIAVIAPTPRAELRARAEDQLARIIPNAAPTYPFVAADKLQAPDAVRAQLQAAGYDAAVVMEFGGINEHTGYERTPRSTNLTWQYADWSQPAVVVNKRTGILVFSVYSVSDGTLLWKCRCQTANPGSLRDILPNVVVAAADRMRRDGLIASPSPTAASPE